ncbi:MAG: RNA polymerase sigma factor, partial [Bdellovibrionales bacterium]|nr:RNA polymerase sigma factor [Bdellovibrionales bacterium]
EIVRHFEAPIRGFCTHILNDPAAGEDAAQETFLKAYRTIRSFRGESSFSSWLFRIARNTCIDILRKQKRESTKAQRHSLYEEGRSEGSASQRLEAQEQLSLLLQALSPVHREILLLREYHHMNYDEISSVLQCSIDAVKGRLKRARQEAQEYLRHLHENENVVQREETL